MLRTISMMIGTVIALCFSTEATPGRPTAPATDKRGDHLPVGAVSRLGSLRWRHIGPVSYVAFAADGKSVISAGADGLFRVWEYPSGKELRRFGPGSAEEISSGFGSRSIMNQNFPIPFAVSKDGKHAAIFGGRKITLYDVATGRERAMLQLP
jgi:WD40 repeat protein